MNCSKQTFSDICSSLCQIQIQKEYDTTLSLHDGAGEASPICSHHTKGRTRLPLWKLLAALGVIAVGWAILRGIISLCSLLSD